MAVPGVDRKGDPQNGEQHAEDQQIPAVRGVWIVPCSYDIVGHSSVLFR